MHFPHQAWPRHQDKRAAPCPELAKASATLPGIARRRERSRTRTALLTVPGTGIDRRPRSLPKDQPGKFPASRFISVAPVRTGCEIRQFVPHDEPLSTALHEYMDGGGHARMQEHASLPRIHKHFARPSCASGPFLALTWTRGMYMIIY